MRRRSVSPLAVLFDVASHATLGLIVAPAALATAALVRASLAAFDPLVVVALSWFYFLAFVALVCGGAIVVSAVLPRPRPGRHAFPLSPQAIGWTTRMVIRRLVFFPLWRELIQGSMLFRSAVLRGLGMRIAASTMSSSDVQFVDPELCEIGADVMIGGGAIISGHTIDERELVLARTVIGPRTKVFLGAVVFPGVQLGADVTVGIRTFLGSFVEVGDNAYLGPQGMVGVHARIGANAVIGPSVHIGSHAEIGDYAIIEEGAVIPAGTRVPEGARWGRERAPVTGTRASGSSLPPESHP